MDLDLLNKSLNYAQKRKKWLILIAALGFSTYGAIRVYNLPSVVKKRERFVKVLGAIASIAELLGDSAETLGVVSKDLKQFIQSDSDEIPNSLRQLFKVAKSNEFSESIVSVTRALTVGILRGYRVGARKGGDQGVGFADKALDKLFSPGGSGFVSVVVGSFVKNMVMAVRFDLNGSSGGTSTENSVQKWVDVIAEEKCRKLIGDCIQQFVSTLVTVYLDKTMDVNPYDQIIEGLTNPKHDEKVKDLLSTFCNGAIETLVKTSHQVIYNPNGKEIVLSGSKSSKTENEGFVSRISSTLAVPSNRKLVLDMTGRVTFATVRSFLDFFFEQVSTGVKRKVDVVHEEAIDKGREVYRYVSTKSYAVMTICLSVWLHVLSSPWNHIDCYTITMAVAKGSTVEVCSNEPGFHGAWYVATLIDVLNPSDQIRYLVQYHTLLTDHTPNAPLTETVHPSFLRPLPPRNLRRNNLKNTAAVVAADGAGSGSGGGGESGDFEMYDVVDAYHRDGWWIGVVTKVVVNSGGRVRRYVVSFEDPVEEVEFGRGQLRLHVDWVDGQWRVPPKKIPEHVIATSNAKRASESNNDARAGLATTNTDNPTVDPILSSIKKKKNNDGNSERAGAVEASDSPRRSKRITNSVGQDSDGKNSQSLAGVEASDSPRRSKRITNAVEQDSGGKNSQSSAGSKGNAKAKRGLDAINQDSPLMEQETINTKTCEAQDGKSGQKKKKGRQIKSLAKGPVSLLQGEHETTADLDNEQPLSQLPGLKRKSCSSLDPHDEPPNQATVTSVGTTDYQQAWPFIKRSPIWDTIASLKIDQTPPQRPHFSPLKEIKENLREGLAIGHMVTFRNVVQMLSELKLTGPIDVINSSLELLGDLETHGFNVGAIRERLNKLLSLKSKVSQHEIKLKEAEEEQEACSGEECAEDMEIKEIEMKMQELHEKMAQSATMMKVKEEEDKKLQLDLHHLSKQMTDIELAFKKLAATPLQKVSKRSSPL